MQAQQASCLQILIFGSLLFESGARTLKCERRVASEAGHESKPKHAKVKKRQHTFHQCAKTGRNKIQASLSKLNPKIKGATQPALSRGSCAYMKLASSFSAARRKDDLNDSNDLAKAVGGKRSAYRSTAAIEESAFLFFKHTSVCDRG